LDVIVDTDVVLGYLGAHQPERAFLEETIRGRSGHICSLSAFELVVAATSSVKARAVDLVLGCLRQVPLDERAVRAAAEVGRQMKSKTDRISIRHILVAGSCISRGLPLVTTDVEAFSKVEGLEIIVL